MLLLDSKHTVDGKERYDAILRSSASLPCVSNLRHFASYYRFSGSRFSRQVHIYTCLKDGGVKTFIGLGTFCAVIQIDKDPDFRTLILNSAYLRQGVRVQVNL